MRTETKIETVTESATGISETVAEASNGAAEGGFTLMEMIIVIALIGMVATFVGANIIGKFNQAKVDTTKIQMRQLNLALDDFMRVCSFYPTTDQGLDALVHKPQGRECKNWAEPFIKDGKIPKDAWNNDFVYLNEGGKAKLRSLGADGAEGGDKLDKDINTDDPDF